MEKKDTKSLSARSRALWLLLLGEPTRSPTTDRLQIDQQPSADQPTMIRRYPGHSPAFVSLRAALSALRSTREALRRSRTLRSLVRRRRGGAGPNGSAGTLLVVPRADGVAESAAADRGAVRSSCAAPQPIGAASRVTDWVCIVSLD